MVNFVDISFKSNMAGKIPQMMESILIGQGIYPNSVESKNITEL